MDGEFLLDTNAIISLLAGDPAVRQKVADSPALLLSIIALGELYYGARKSSRPESNLARIEELIKRSTLIGCDSGTAFQFGIIKNDLRSKGRPIPECDLWIAATARQHGLIVVSRDNHFADISGLIWEQW
jgi:tRNA(fMet)-specific endonuclease VapC